MPIHDERPTLESIRALEKHWSGIWNKMHSKMRRVDSFVDGTFNVWPDLPLGIARSRAMYRPSTARTIVERATDNQIAYKPKITREPIGDTEQAEAESSEIETFLQAVLEASTLDETVLFSKQTGRNLFQYGYANLHGPVMDYSGFPTKLKGESEGVFEGRFQQFLDDGFNPFRILVMNPARVLLDPQEKRPRAAIFKTMYSSQQLHSITKKRKSKTIWSASDPYEIHPTWVFYSDNYRAMIIEKTGDEIYVEENKSGFTPFTHAFSGWGYEPTDLEVMDPAFMGASILEPVFDSLLRQAQIRTALTEAVMRTGYSRLVTTQDADVMAEKMQNEIVGETTPGELRWMDAPNIPTWMLEQAAWIDRDIEQGTFSLVLGGFREPGVTTVGQHAMQTTSAIRKFIAPNKQLDYMVSVICENILRLVEKFDRPITIRGKKLRPSIIKGNYSVLVQYEVVDPVIQLQVEEIAMRKHATGLISSETTLEVFRIEDISEERNRLLEDDVRNHPGVKHLLGEVAAMRMGLADMWAKVQELEAQATGTAPLSLSPTASPGGERTASPAEPGSPREAADAANQLRQPLDGQTAKPGRSIPLG